MVKFKINTEILHFSYSSNISQSKEIAEKQFSVFGSGGGQNSTLFTLVNVYVNLLVFTRIAGTS